MGKNVIRIPKTVGEFIELLKQYPQESDLSIFVPDIYDNGSVWSSQSFRVGVNFHQVLAWKSLELTFANGNTLPME